jgi:hypothetical protein
MMLADDGNRVLRLAAREADIVGFSLTSANKPGADPQQVMADRVGFVQAGLGRGLRIWSSTCSCLRFCDWWR